MIDLADAKAQLNITDDGDDALIQGKIDAASAWIALYTGSTNTDATVPAPVMEACRLITAHLYQNREASLVGVTAQALPFGVLDLLAPYRAYAF